MFVILDFFQPGNYTTIWSAVISGVDAVSEISVRKSEIVLFCWKRVAHPLSRVLSSIISFCFLFIRLDAKVFFSAKRSTRQQQVFDSEKTLFPSCGAWMHGLWRTLWPALSSWAFDLGNKHFSSFIIHYSLTNFQLIVYLHTWINGQCLDLRVYLA